MRLLRRREPEAEPEPELPTPPPPAIVRFGSSGANVWTLASDVPGLTAGGPSTLHERVGTASRCLQLCAQQVASLPLRYRRDTPAAAGKSYAPPWVATPDPAWYPNGIRDALFGAAWSYYAQGDAFLWATSRNAEGYPATWTVLDPLSMDVRSEGGRRVYKSNSVPLSSDDVLQITRNPTGALRGTGALAAYASNLTAAFQADGYAADIVGGGGVPPAVIKSARRLTSDQAADVKGQWMTQVGGARSAPAVLPPDLDFEQLAFSPRDLMLLESREFDAKQIAAAFGVPPPLLNMTLSGGMTYASASMLFDEWWRSELFPGPCRAIESALSTVWLPRGSWVEFDPRQSLQPDFAALSTTWIALVNAGIATEDEARAAVLDLPPLTQGEAIAELDEPAGAHGSAASAPEVTPAPTLEVVQ